MNKVSEYFAPISITKKAIFYDAHSAMVPKNRLNM